MSIDVNGTLMPEQKAATVVVALGTDKASKLFKYLSNEDAEKLALEVAKLGHLEAEVTEQVLDEFYKTCLTQKVVTDGGLEYARAVLEKAYGENAATELLQKVSKYLKNRSFDFIEKADVKNLFSILQHERAQTIALVLSYVESDKAAAVIAELPEEKRIQVVKSIAMMDSASPEAIKIVEQQLRSRFDNILTTDFTSIGGIDCGCNEPYGQKQREVHFRRDGQGRSGTYRRDPQEDVRIRGYPYNGQQVYPAFYQRLRYEGCRILIKRRGRGDTCGILFQHVQSYGRTGQVRFGGYSQCKAA